MLATDEAEMRARDREKTLMADVDAARQRAQRLDGEIAALRSIASSAVNEVQSLGEQLIAALAENQELAAVLVELRATSDMLDSELAASRRGAEVRSEAAGHLLASGENAPPVELASAPAPRDGLTLEAVQASETAQQPVSGFGPPAMPLDELALADAQNCGMTTIRQDLDLAPGSDEIEPRPTGWRQKLAALIKGSFVTRPSGIAGHTDVGVAANIPGATIRRQLGEPPAGPTAEHRQIRLVVSGGQSGAAEAALAAAKRLGIPTAGYMPKGFRTETGSRPDLARTYGLEECSSAEYSNRARRNVLIADGTLIFSRVRSEGAEYTAQFAQLNAKPYLIIPPTMTVEEASEHVHAWLLANHIAILNVGGSRISQAPTVATFVSEVLEGALRDASASRQ